MKRCESIAAASNCAPKRSIPAPCWSRPSPPCARFSPGVGRPSRAFRQADNTLDRALGGLGIGLNVVKSLVEMHFWRVTVESAGTNAGTTATVRLPSLLEWPAAGSPPAAPALDAAPPKPVRVLIVDDHIDAAETLELLLQLRGCETHPSHPLAPSGVTVHVHAPSS